MANKIKFTKEVDFNGQKISNLAIPADAIAVPVVTVNSIPTAYSPDFRWIRIDTLTNEDIAILNNKNISIIKLDLSILSSYLGINELYIKRNTSNTVAQGGASVTFEQFEFSNDGFNYEKLLDATAPHIENKELGNGAVLFASDSNVELIKNKLFICRDAINPTIMWTRIGDCEKVIPEEASEQNQLADKAYVDARSGGGTQLYRHDLQYDDNAYEIKLISTSGTRITHLFSSSFDNVISGTYRDHGTTYSLLGVTEPGPDETNVIYLNQQTITKGTLNLAIPESSTVTKL